MNRYQKPPLRVEDIKKKDDGGAKLLGEGEKWDLSEKWKPGEDGREPVEENAS